MASPNSEYLVAKAIKNARISFNREDNSYQCLGSWSVETVNSLSSDFLKIEQNLTQQLVLDGENIEYFDSAAALALYNLIEECQKKGHEVILRHFSPDQKNLLQLITDKKNTIYYEVVSPRLQPLLERLGEESIHKLNQTTGLLNLIGDLSCTMTNAFGKWKKFRWASIISNIDSAGLQSLPILALLSFLIGVVLAYQMGLQLQTYGANIFIAYLSTMAIFREFGPLITAIIVAGRTSSAFTAQLGSMKINEEIDALETMGLSPTELLVMPKVIGLVLVFPLLIFWSDLFSLIGAMMMSKAQLGVSYADFLIRVKESIGLKQLMLGLYKAPIFALIISLVGCFQGFSVKPTADSVGHQTTKAVVQALFLIIIADALYSVTYSWMDL